MGDVNSAPPNPSQGAPSRVEAKQDQTLATRNSQLATLLLLGLLLASTFFLAFFELSDYDIWYHLKAGELIPERGVPQKDWFCFKSVDEDWIDVHWGFQRVVAELYGQFGSAGLVWMKSVAAVLAMAFALTAYRKNWPRSVQALVWIVPLLLMSSRFYERPEIFTLVFTAIYLHVLFHAEEHPARLWFLPVIQVMWANVQGLFVFGPALLGMYWAEALFRIDRVRGLFRHLMPVTLLVFAACTASPYGLRNLLLVWQISQTATSSLYTSSIAELRSFRKLWEEEGAASDIVSWLVLGTLAISALTTLMALPVIWRERRLFRVLPAIVFGYVGLQAIRNVNHFALVAGTIASWNLGSLALTPRPSRRPILLALLVTAGLCYAVASEHWSQLATPTRALGTGERPNYYPREAMKKAGLPGMPDRALVMHNGEAALYEYMNYPKKTYADARLEVHAMRTYKDYTELCNLLRKPNGPGEGVLRSEQIDLVAADGDQYAEVQAAFFNNPNWVCIHYDEIIALFLRAGRSPPPGVTKWDAKQELFRQQAPLLDLPIDPPSSPRWLLSPPGSLRKGRDDLLTVRAGYVWEKMATGDYAPPENIRLWNMIQLQAARRAAARRPWKADSYRALGYACLGGVRQGVTLDNATELPDIVPIASAMFNFKQTLKIDPSDFYARFWMGQTLMNLGEYELAARELEYLKSVWPRDRQQVKALAPGGQLDMALDEAKRKYNGRGLGDERNGVDPTLPRDQRLAESFKRSVRYLFIGDAANGYAVADEALATDTMGTTDDAATNLVLLEAAAQVAMGRPTKAIEVLDSYPRKVAQGDWFRAWLAVQAGDRETARKAIAAGKTRNPSPTTARALDQLEQLVK